jgi:hypothetical protein
MQQLVDNAERNFSEPPHVFIHAGDHTQSDSGRNNQRPTRHILYVQHDAIRVQNRFRLKTKSYTYTNSSPIRRDVHDAMPVLIVLNANTRRSMYHPFQDGLTTFCNIF